MLIVPESIRFFCSIAILYYLNMIPLLWTLIFFKRGNLIEKSNITESEYLTDILDRKSVTAREKEIIQLILAGKSNGEIEDILYISSHTVKNHIYNIYRKLNVGNRYEMISLLSFNKLT
jgi:DNA-binding CsgD family transcriptional regulator